MILSKELTSQNNQVLNLYVLSETQNTPVNNANIQLLNSQRGTISSFEGFCQIRFDTLPIVLEVSHISFDSKILEINNFNLEDTFYVFLEPKLIILNEVNIYSDKKAGLKKLEYNIIDFGFLENQLLVLESARSIRKRYRILIQDDKFQTKSIFNLPLRFDPKKIYEDCLGNSHLLTEDSAYQINFENNLLTLCYPVEIERFNSVLKDCLFSTDSLLFFQDISVMGYAFSCYCINIDTYVKTPFIADNDIDRYFALQDNIRFIKDHPSRYPIEFSIRFEKEIMCKPYKQYLTILNDTIFYFNHQNASIDLYSKDRNFIKKFNIDYHKSNGWLSKILVDKTMGKAYTTINNNLLEINLSNGETVFKTKLGLAKKVLLNNGYAFILKKDFNLNRFETFIRKVKIE